MNNVLSDFENLLNVFNSDGLAYLTPQELTELDTLLSPLWKPQKGPQTQAYNSPADVLGYGGAAGGGKTDLLIGLALSEHNRSIIFRREAVQLRAIIDRAREILGNTGSFNQNTGAWSGLPGGRKIEFQGCKDPGDEQKYRGQPHDFIGFDEADQFTEYQVRFLSGWNRTTKKGQRCRIVLAFNPPATAEGRWLLNYFGPWVDTKHPSPAKPGELRWYAMLPDGKEEERPDGEPFAYKGERITPKSRTFIPARVQDNRYLMDTDYLATLQALPEPLRSQLLKGDMLAGLEDDPWQVVPTAWIQAAMDRWKPEKGEQKLSALGVDVARGGQAKTVIAKRYGYWWAPLLKYPGSQTPDGPSVAALIQMAAKDNYHDCIKNIDVIGVGSSAFDACRALNMNNVVGINFGGGTKATDRAGVLRFANIRAWAYWTFRELLDPANGHDVQLPPDKELMADLSAPKWQAIAGGIKIEKKEEIEKRIGRSPDCADSVVYSIIVAR